MPFGLNLAPQHRVYSAFAIYSFSLGNLFPRLPQIQHAMGIGEGALGLALLGTPIGTLIALTFAAPLLERIGFRRAVLSAIPLVAVLFFVASLAPNAWVFFVLLLPVGLTIGCIELMLNLEADRTEHAVGFRIMNRAHAFWSIGFFAAALFGAGLAQLGLTPQLHLFIAIPISLLGTMLLLGRYEPSPNRAGTSTEAAPRFSAPSAAIMVLVGVTLCAMLMEGASTDWSAIYMRNLFNPGPFVVGLGVASFAFFQAATRFFADRFVERYSPTAVARTLLAVLFVATFVVFVSPDPILSLTGFALIGFGTSGIFPLAMSAAAQRSDRPAATNVAALAQTSFVMFLLAPPLLGGIAQSWGIRWSFGIGLPLIVLGFLLAGNLGSRPMPHGAPAE